MHSQLFICIFFYGAGSSSSSWMSCISLRLTQLRCSYSAKLKIIGGIKYTKSTIRNQSLIQKRKFFTNVSKMIFDVQPTGSKNCGSLKTIQLPNGGFSYVSCPLMRIFLWFGTKEFFVKFWFAVCDNCSRKGNII